MSDDDFRQLPQFTQRSSQQAVSSTSRAQVWDRAGPSRGPESSGGPRPSQLQPSQEALTQLTDTVMMLSDRLEQLTGNSRGIKRPAEQKPNDKKRDTKEQCYLCKKLFANMTTLFRHYRAIHKEMNPEKYHGCSVNSTVVSLDMSLRDITCDICGYVATNQNALEAHNRAVHSNVGNVNSNDANIRTASIASVNSNNTDVNGTVGGVVNKENVNNNITNGMHKCEECAGYFVRRNELDEHMKDQHGYEVVCKICNKNLLFKDYNSHVKDSHPDVYDKNEKLVIEKVMRKKNGDRVKVFNCTTCDHKTEDKIKAEHHARGHKKGLKIKVAPRNKVSKAKENLTHVTPDNDDLIILTCDACDVSTDSYDVAVEHSQIHITSNSNDIQFVTQQCLICALKFEPLCYKKHIDLHYSNKEIHKESFKYSKYRFQMLLSENWSQCFNMSEDAFKDMQSKSIYEHTRSVKMRVAKEGAYKLYKCCQCYNFVEPSAVLNHTINYDTCMKVKRSHACAVCKRKFNNRFARDCHAKDHRSEDNYKIVFFNHDLDKKINEILNDPNITHGHNNNADVNAPKLLYKCLCGVCFVLKENADKHKKICPAKEPKKSCPKCNNMFHLEELLTHCFEHHFNETRIVIENISPDAIVIDSDDDIIEIDSSDDDDAQTERFSNIKIEILRGYDATAVRGPDEGTEPAAERQNTNASETAMTEASENIEVASGETLLLEKSEKDDVDENEDQCDDDFGGVDNAMTDEDSQDTIYYENTETGTAAANPANLKCVPMNLLLEPLPIERRRRRNAEVPAGIDNASSTNASVLFDTAIKQEKSRSDPTDFSNIRSRRSLREIPASYNLSQEIVELLLTDDEEAEVNNVGDATGNENNTPCTHNETNNVICEDEHTEMTESNGQRVDINDATHSFHGDAEYNKNKDLDHSDNDDDLFVPSGIANREQPQNTELNVNEKEMSNNPLHDEQVVAQVASAYNTTHSRDNNENIVDHTEINENTSDENNHDDTNQENAEDTQDYVESTPNEPTNRIINDMAENVASRKALTNKTRINKAFANMIMNIKREFSDENEQEPENGGHGTVRIKSEPKENEDKENDVSVISNRDDVNGQCTIC